MAPFQLMFEVHTTKSGEKMLIAQMSNSHLLQTIKLFASRIQACVVVLESNLMPGGAIVQALRPEFSQENLKEKATDSIVFYHSKIQPYVLEAALRGLTTQKLLQDAYGRTEKMPTANLANILLPSRSDVFDPDDEEDCYKEDPHYSEMD